MDHLDELSLSEIRLIDPWSNAKRGTLLQMLVKGRPTIGLRCNFITATAAQEGLAIIAGVDMGKVAVDVELSGAAFDVSEIVEIVIGRLGPLLQRPQQLPPGLTVHHGDAYYLYVEVLSGSGSGFIRVADGEYFAFASLPATGQTNIGAAIGVRMREPTLR
jgi:hypothetical protein